MSKVAALHKPQRQVIKAPKHLRPATRRWYEQVCEEYEFESHHLRLLQLAGESWDRCQEARQKVTEEGLSYTDDKGIRRAHPCTAIERDSRLAFARIVRELNLSEEPADSRPRPLRYGG
jgi:P27 family predicted phage terminase small subunit